MVGRPIEYLDEFSADLEANYHATLVIAPHLADAVRDNQPIESYAGTAVPNYFRRPYGPGWALVGDAGLSMDPLNGHGEDIETAVAIAELNRFVLPLANRDELERQRVHRGTGVQSLKEPASLPAGEFVEIFE